MSDIYFAVVCRHCGLLLTESVPMRSLDKTVVEISTVLEPVLFEAMKKVKATS